MASRGRLRRACLRHRGDGGRAGGSGRRDAPLLRPRAARRVGAARLLVFVTWPQYTGQTIVATGKVRRFGDEIEVVAARPRDIVVAPGTPGPATQTAVPTEAQPTPVATPVPQSQPTPTAASGDAEVERLRRKVEQLEERVRELEGGERPAP